MPKFALLEELEDLHAAYNDCSEHLAKLLNEVKETGRPSLEMINKIKGINQRYDELLDKYVSAYKANYGES